MKTKNIVSLSSLGKLLLLLFVLMVYTFFFIDEELLVSLVTIIVLVGLYDMFSALLNKLFMSNINELFKKISLYLVVNMILLQRVASQFSNISLSRNYMFIYSSLVCRVLYKVYKSELSFITLVNNLVHDLYIFFSVGRIFSGYGHFVRAYVRHYFLKKFRFCRSLIRIKLKFLFIVSNLIFKK